MQMIPLRLLGVFLPPMAAMALLSCGDWPPSRYLIAQKDRVNVQQAAFRDEGGRRFTLAEFQGKVVLLQLWSPKIPLSLDVLQEIAALQAGQGEQAVVLAVSTDAEGFPGARTFIEMRPELRLQVVLPDGPSGLAPFGNWSAVPSTLVVDREGRVRERWNGHLWGRATKALRTALKER